MLWEAPDESAASCDAPGIYRFTIEGVGIYVGRFTRARRPLREYRLNVEKLLDGRPYRPGKPLGFRRVHRALHKAVIEKTSIRLEIVENVPSHRLNERERFWIDQVPLAMRLNGRSLNQ